MDGIDVFSIVSAINSAGDTLTVEEAKGIVAEHHGDPRWVDERPEWVKQFNQMLRRRVAEAEEKA
jgi:hypothetical protein